MMEVLKETFKDVSGALTERIRNPFIWSFLIAWLFINWRPLAYLTFSNLPIEHTVFHIDKKYALNRTGIMGSL